MRKDNAEERIYEALAYLGQHAYTEATKKWRELRDEYTAKVIDESLSEAAINVRTTALNLDIKSLATATQSKATAKAGHVSGAKERSLPTTPSYAKNNSSVRSAGRYALRCSVKVNQKYSTTTACSVNKTARTVAHPMHVA